MSTAEIQAAQAAADGAAAAMARALNRFAALDASGQRAVFAYLAGRCPEHAAEALRLNEPAPSPIPFGEGVGGSTSATHTMPAY